MHANNGHADTSQLDILMNGIKDNFNVNPILLLPPLVVILAIALKMPAIPWYHTRCNRSSSYGSYLPEGCYTRRNLQQCNERIHNAERNRVTRQSTN